MLDGSVGARQWAACADKPIWDKKGTRKGLPRIRVRCLLKFNLLNKVLKAFKKIIK